MFIFDSTVNKGDKRYQLLNVTADKVTNNSPVPYA